ncbi:MAG: hypothetical protein JWM59_1909 [Verrucomicrobiales bacterium]|nr:hypothetical protein [Verrucomicrobiales bacterium]
MTTEQQFQLIDGIFTPSQASRVLLSLVKCKIDYHHIEKLSNEERFGGDAAHSESHLHYLAKLHTSLKEYLALAAQANQTLEIEGCIKIKPVRNIALSGPGKP